MQYPTKLNVVSEARTFLLSLSSQRSHKVRGTVEVKFKRLLIQDLWVNLTVLSAVCSCVIDGRDYLICRVRLGWQGVRNGKWCPMPTTVLTSSPSLPLCQHLVALSALYHLLQH